MLRELVASVIQTAWIKAGYSAPPDMEITPAARPEFGDFSSNVALVAGKIAGKPPRELAADLVRSLDDPLIERVEIAGPGFLNFTLAPSAIHDALRHVLHCGSGFGRDQSGAGIRLQVEFVSSNPTGPLTVGHGRQAVLGDVLA
ncbi:arginine--tRNA ligase, partial [Candidatus Bipolaricaulota bacterium]|nr:arginine--tRNA ligase [Candidatus Bipolaricaulota bacterium]